MVLSSGSRLGNYEILEPLGAGGMGEVYRARDRKLDRDVALKVLPDEFASDRDRMARFEREAKVLASLNHHHIASIHGLEEAGSMRALVMEVVEGPTLAERIEHIERGSIPIDEAVTIAKQIAEALEYAHERSIIHRDLKPANVKLTEEGDVKLLDFGLAKALEGDTGKAQDDSHSPTLTRGAGGARGARATEPAFSWGRRDTCLQSKPKENPSIVAPISGRSASCCSRCSPAGVCSRARPHRRRSRSS